MTPTPIPVAQPGWAYLLSAGPGAGKTHCLKQWAAAWGPTARYFKLPPTLSLGPPLSERLLALFPEAQEAYLAYCGRFPHLSWGASLGLALERTIPGAILLLDDLHLLERCHEWADLLALFRHFPPQGMLAIASRHRIPPIGRDVTHWEGSFALGHPSAGDLSGLGDGLLASFFILHLLDAQPPSAESDELVRRGMAEATRDGLHAVSMPWRSVAEQALLEVERPEVWRSLAERLTAHYRRRVRTGAEDGLRAAWARLPLEARAPFESLWHVSPLPEDEAGLHVLLDQPVRNDRLACHRHFQALAGLYALARKKGDLTEAAGFAGPMVAAAQHFGFEKDLLSAHVARLEATMLADPPGALSAFLAIPLEAFAHPEGLGDYVRCLRDRAHLLQETELAERLEAVMRRVFGEVPPLGQMAPAPLATLRIRAFGGFVLIGPEGTELRCTRRKALLLLALLTLHPRGLFAEELIASLFGPGEVSEPLDSLHGLTYAARRTLKEAGFDHLLENEGGCYRLRWQEVAFCDLHEFEAFKEYAMLLEARGFRQAADLMQEIAAAYTSGEPFEGLASELGARHLALARRHQLGVRAVP